MPVYGPCHLPTWLLNQSPQFRHCGEKVKFLEGPEEFFKTLKQQCLSCRHRIVLSSLYLGTSAQDKEFVHEVEDACARAETNGLPFECVILLDYTRATRGSPNSCTMLSALLKKFSRYVNVCLYHTPKLRGLLKYFLPGRWNEIVGVQHMKIYLFDDNVILSGANLSESYYTNRQDRYVLIQNCSALADYCADLVNTVCECSFQLHDDGDIELHPSCVVHPYSGNYDHFAKMMRSRLEALKSSWTEKQDSNADAYSFDCDTCIIPLLQAGPIGIREDEEVILRALNASCLPGAKLDIASGYFNITSEYSDVLLTKGAPISRILMAAPAANGFYNGSGISGYVPSLYSYVAKLFYDKVAKLSQCHRLRMFEYCRPGWTFHSKGLWLTLPSQSVPSVTFVGSTNYGYRSIHRDLELQFAIVTESDLLKQRMQTEVDHLFQPSSLVDASTFKKPDYFVPLWVRLVARVMRNFF